jgi:hypothetical protein
MRRWKEKPQAAEGSPSGRRFDGPRSSHGLDGGVTCTPISAPVSGPINATRHRVGASSLQKAHPNPDMGTTKAGACRAISSVRSEAAREWNRDHGAVQPITASASASVQCQAMSACSAMTAGSACMRGWQREHDPASERLSGGVENEVAQAGAVLRPSDGPRANAGHGGLFFRKGRDPACWWKGSHEAAQAGVNRHGRRQPVR